MKTKGNVFEFYKKSNKGITLVALVVTIIILLILAGVTLKLTVGENGIITNARIAKNEYEVSFIKEKLSFWYLENSLNKTNTDPVIEIVDSSKIKDNSTLEKIVEFQNEAENISEINFSSLYYLDLEKLGLKGSIEQNKYFMDINTKIIFINEGITLKEGKIYILEEKEILPIVLTAEETENGFKLIISLNNEMQNIEKYEYYINNELYITTQNTEIEVNDKKFGEYNCFVTAKNYQGENYSSRTINAENYIIKQLEDFEILRTKIEEGNYFEGKTIKVIQDIDFNGSTTDRKWIPIGNDNAKFKGTLEGNNHKISNIYNKNTLENNQGLFGVVQNATIKNIQIASGQIEANKYSGAIVGKSINSSIINCSNQAYVFAQKGFAGGIIGATENSGNVENCSNSGKVTSEEYVNDVKDTIIGGIVGYNPNATIKHCTNSGIIESKYCCIGGIVGANSGDILNCENTGTIRSTERSINNDAAAGGIVGYANAVKIENCNNTGLVSAYGNSIGGIAGVLDNCTVLYCNNSNTITQNSGVYTGGIVGAAWNGGTIENCVNTGKIYIFKGNNNNNNGLSGGIVGTAHRAKVNLCVNKGNVEAAAAYIGGIVGNAMAEITNSHNEGVVKVTSPNISNNACAGGIAGQVDANNYLNAKIENCYNTNTVYGEGDHVAGISSWANGNIINCYNTAYISASGGIVGGILGDNSPTTSGVVPEITNCYNTGKIESKTYAISIQIPDGTSYSGGITGANHGNLTKCWNSGEVIGTSIIGGIAGLSDKTMTESYNIGIVKSIGKDQNNNSALGGVCGYFNSGTISYCYNRGEIIADYYCVGGIIGVQCAVATVSNSYNAFQIQEGTNKSYLVGYAENGATQPQCYYIGTTTSGQQRTEADMKTSEFINLLGGTSKWKLDSSNKNEGFVILSWQ